MADAPGGGFDVAKLVTGGLAVISTLGALVGTFTGAVPRLLRNYPGYFTVGLILTVVAVGLSFAASVATRPATKVEQVVSGTAPNTTTATTTADASSGRAKTARIVLTSLSFVAFGISIIVFVHGLEKSATAGDQPRLSANWIYPNGEQPMLTVHMQLDDLNSFQTVYVNVVPLGGSATKPVYRSQTGADSDGVADETFDVPLPRNATGLQIVASIDHATTCTGDRLPELVLPSAASASEKNASVVANGSPSPRPILSGVAPPVTQSKSLAFSCIQVIAPAKPLSSPAISPSRPEISATNSTGKSTCFRKRTRGDGRRRLPELSTQSHLS